MPDRTKIVRVILASAGGTMIEWYDFYIFGSLTAVLSVKFYPPGNDTFAYIAYLATFAVGFLVRPFGALFFGRDRRPASAASTPFYCHARDHGLRDRLRSACCLRSRRRAGSRPSC